MAARLAADLYAKHPDPPHRMIVVLEDGHPNAGAAAQIFSDFKSSGGLGVHLENFILGGKNLPGLQLADLISHRTWRRESKDPAPAFTPVTYPLTLSELREKTQEPMAVYRHQLDRDFLAAYKSDIIESDAKRFAFGGSAKSG